jgi:hypothetical protein
LIFSDPENTIAYVRALKKAEEEDDGKNKEQGRQIVKEN